MLEEKNIIFWETLLLLLLLLLWPTFKEGMITLVNLVCYPLSSISNFIGVNFINILQAGFAPVDLPSS